MAKKKKKNLSYRKKLTKKESKKYTKLEKKAKKVVSKNLSRIFRKSIKITKSGIPKVNQKKFLKSQKKLAKQLKKNKTIKALNKYKKKLDKKYTKKKKKKTAKSIMNSNTLLATDISNEIKSKATNRAYMIDENTQEVFIFQFNPEKVPYERKVTYNTIDSPGQAYPQTQFAKGEALEFSVELFMYTPIVRETDIEHTKTRSLNVSGNRLEGKKVWNLTSTPVLGYIALDDRINKARTFLEGLLPPMSNSNSFSRPHLCTFAFGYFVQNQCVVTSLKVEDERLDSMGVPIQTKFNITLRKV